MPSDVALASLSSSPSCMQDELALVKEELAQVKEDLRPLRQELLEEATKQAQGARNDRLLDALEAKIRPLATKEQMLLEEEHAMRLKAQATGEQLFQLACHAVVPWS